MTPERAMHRQFPARLALARLALAAVMAGGGVSLNNRKTHKYPRTRKDGRKYAKHTPPQGNQPQKGGEDSLPSRGIPAPRRGPRRQRGSVRPLNRQKAQAGRPPGDRRPPW